jgi:hypothetical protein
MPDKDTGAIERKPASFCATFCPRENIHDIGVIPATKVSPCTIGTIGTDGNFSLQYLPNKPNFNNKSLDL